MEAPAVNPLEPPRPLRRFEDLPGPRGLPLIGNLLQVKATRLHLQMEAWCRRYGPLFKLRLGRRRIVVVADHALIAQVLRERPDGFGRSTRLQQIGTEMGLKPGVFGVNGEMWKRQRRMVMAGFDPAHIRRYFPALQQVAARLVQRWQRAAEAGRTIDLQADLMRYTVDTIAGLAFGAEVDTLGTEGNVIQQHLDQIFPALFGRVIAPLPWWRFVRLPADRRLERSMTAVNAAVEGFIGQARARLAADPARRQRPHNLLEAMLVASEQEGSGIDDAQVAGNVLTMLLAGEDTTANTLAWAIWLLWCNPQALARAAAEVRHVVGAAEVPTTEQLEQLDYLEACTHETMRLKPVAPLIGAEAARATVVGDLHVEPGTVIFNLMRHDGVSEQHVADAAAFEPERWLQGGQAGTLKRTSMPFGAGPRICPGRQLALLEMKMALAVLLAQFDIERVFVEGGGEPKEFLALAMAPVGLRMRLRVRARG